MDEGALKNTCLVVQLGSGKLQHEECRKIYLETT